MSPGETALAALGATVQLAAEVRDQNDQVMTGAAVTWTSAATAVATVDTLGLVTAAGNGTATITATAGSVSGGAEVTVAQEARQVAVSPLDGSVGIGKTLRLGAEATDANGHAVEGAEFSWSSSDPAVATVDSTGLVTGVAEGEVTVTAASGDAEGAAGITVYISDRSILVALYEAANGAGWIETDGWLSDRPLGEWHGITTGADGRVTELRLPASNLEGTLPALLGSLSALEVLDFHRNVLTGSIPPELGKLTTLKSLNLGVNRFEGPIPPELGALTNLEELLLRRNSLSGPLPPELGNLRNLIGIGLKRNRLTGALPRGFMAFERLRTLHFEVNDGLCAPTAPDFLDWLDQLEAYVGPLCDERDRAALESLFEATDGPNWTRSDGWVAGGPLNEWYGVETDSIGQVAAVNLSDNGLAGSLPATLADLEGLTSLRIDGNAALTGRLPATLTKLPLRELRYGGTGLCVPTSASFQEWLNAVPSHEGTDVECSVHTDRDILALLYESMGGHRWHVKDGWLSERPLSEWHGVSTDGDGRVTEIVLVVNGLSGSIPPELGGLSELAHLILGLNSLSGPIPPELANLSKLRSLDVVQNKLVGPLPSELGNLSNLTSLNVSNNDLAGPIPTELAQLSKLEVLNLGGNRLIGPIPPKLGQLSGLEVLNLGRNRLTGPVPPVLGQLSNLEILELPDNELTGPIPAELGSLSNLGQLRLSDNRLSGPISPTLGSLPQLRQLFLANNLLTGPIPPELGQLSNLEILELPDNELTGPIPPELGALPRLTRLWLGGNRLSGAVPPELGALTQLVALSLGRNPELSGALPQQLQNLTGLQYLALTDTGLCAPDTPAFQDWLASIRTAFVQRCRAATGSIAYLTQAVQSDAFPVPLVEGDPALLRVLVTASDSTSAGIPPVRATFYVDGAETHVADIPGTTTPIPTSLEEAEASLDKSANIEIPASVIVPELEMVIEIDPDNTLDPGLGVTKRIPETGRAAVSARAVPVLNLTFVPFLWIGGSDSTIVETANDMAADPAGHELLWDTRTLLPVRDFNISVREPLLTSTTDIFSLWYEVVAARVMDGSTDKYMGLMPEYLVGGQSGLAGDPVGFSVDDSFVIGHELGHIFSLGHAPCGGAGGIDAAFPQPDASVGAWGYDFRDGGSLVPPHARDLMSYCGPPRWVSGYHFTKAMNYRIETAAEASSIAADAHAGDAAGDRTRALLLWGGVDALGEPFLEPAFVVDAPPAVPSSPGGYELTGRTETGDRLFSLSFDMVEIHDGGGRFGFAYALPAPTEWADALASLTLSGPGGTTTIDMATDQPMSILRDPESGRVLGILREPTPAVERGLDVLTSRGIPTPEAWRRN